VAAQNQEKQILDAICELGLNWTLQTAVGFVNTWSSELKTRLHSPVKIFRLQKKFTSSYCDFYFFDENHAHVLLFQVAHKNESKYWVARRDFKEAFEILLKLGICKISASVLTCTSEYPLEASRREWRSEDATSKGCKMTKLALFWRRIGFIDYPALQTGNRDAILLVAPKTAKEAKGQFLNNGLPNPYRFLSHSVYEPDLEKDLKN
jgi:hypothetical protein